MKVSVAATSLLTCLAAAAPTKLSRRAQLNDADILNYALTLEHLENRFYLEGLSKFSKGDFAAAGFDATFYNNLRQVSVDESTHVKFLTTGLKAAGATPVKECKYDFGFKDVKSFVALASVLEGVGVTAYLGAAAEIMSKTYLTAAGSILTVEARHSSYFRASLDEAPVAQPFDVPLTFNEVYTLAAPFIVSCPPSNPKLPLKPFPALTATGSGATIKTGSTVELSVAKKHLKGHVCAAFIGPGITGPISADVQKSGGKYSVKVPSGIAGQSYVVLTDCSKKVSDDSVVAGPAIVEISGTV